MSRRFNAAANYTSEPFLKEISHLLNELATETWDSSIVQHVTKKCEDWELSSKYIAWDRFESSESCPKRFS